MDTEAATSYRHGPAGRAIRELPPAAFAFVMATGIISAGARALGPAWLSRLLLAVATAGFLVLAAMLTIRLVRFPARALADLRSPDQTFGYFTVVAGIDVLGVRLGRV